MLGKKKTHTHTTNSWKSAWWLHLKDLGNGQQCMGLVVGSTGRWWPIVDTSSLCLAAVSSGSFTSYHFKKNTSRGCKVAEVFSKWSRCIQARCYNPKILCQVSSVLAGS